MERECTCDQLGHPCDVHDTTGSPDVVRGKDEGVTYDNLLKEQHKLIPLAIRVGHLKFNRWMEALRTGECFACPNEISGNVGCLTCPGNRQDCECYEHQEDGPTDDQLRELIQIRDIREKINELNKKWTNGKGVLPVTYIKDPISVEVEYDEDEKEEKLSTKRGDMDLKIYKATGFPASPTLIDDPGPDKPYIKYGGKTYTAEGVIDDETGEFIFYGQ